ncbi:acetolactate synthase catalytic subunit [Oceanobacillus oncorhynchi subsp. oncorhynchi]|uniref:acetolactate synthase catalytic subunit n=1 Tax=Oceanobacillus oncorhynchi TaxID=545501 RepID=UPI0031E43949
MSTKVLNNAQRMANVLKKNGVEYLFGQSNPPAITLACDDIGIKQIGYRQENAGSYMAQGYAMATGKIPVVTAQNGPAATLLVPGLAESKKSSYPVVAIVEEVDQSHEEKNAFQEFDHFALFSGVSKWTKKISIHEKIEEYVDRAFTVAASGRPGPVVLLCPKDIFNDTKKHTITVKDNQCNLGEFPLDRFAPTDTLLAEASKLLANAERPLIYAGGGVVSSGGHDALRNIQENFNIPVATTTMGKGSIDENHNLSIGPIGYYMGIRGVTRYLKNYVENSDVILLIGNRTNQNGTDSWSLLPENAKYIHIDIDPTEIGRNYDSLRLVGDAKTTLEKLHETLESEDISKRAETREEFENEISEARKLHEKAISDVLDNQNNEQIKVERFLREVNQQLADDHIIVADASISSVWNANYIKAEKNRKFIFPRGLAGLGWGLPLAMGAKVGLSNRKVFCLVGDGGFGHVWSELETCKRLGIDVVVAVINNSVLGYQKYAETVGYNRYTNVCDFSFVDHTKVAEACDVKGIKLDDVNEISNVLNEAFNHEGSVLIDLISDSVNIPPVTIMDGLIEAK